MIDKTKHVIYQNEKHKKSSYSVPYLPSSNVTIEKRLYIVDHRQSQSLPTVMKLGNLYAELKMMTSGVLWYHFQV